MNARLALATGAVAVALLGCSRQAGPGLPPTVGTTPPDVRAAQALRPPTASPSQLGADQEVATDLLKAARTTLPLTAAQSFSVQVAEHELLASQLNVGGAFGSLSTHLADQVRTGAIDPGKVQADEIFVQTALSARRSREIDALSTAHAVLDRDQRTAVAATVRAERPRFAEESARSRAERGPARRLDRLTRDLALDAGQQQQVAGVLAAEPSVSAARPAEQQRGRDSVLGAFPTDAFDARAAVEPEGASPAEATHERIQQRTEFLSKLLPILRPAQRDKLASSVEMRDWQPDRPGGA